MEQILRGSRKWIKLWVDEYLMGTTRFELTPEERGVWIDLLAMAGKSRDEGKIYAGKYENKIRGYPLEYLAGILLVSPETLQRTLEKCEKYEKIKVEYDENKNIIIEILNWSKYQSEYNRQKQYRLQQRLQQKNKKVTQKVTNQVINKVTSKDTKKLHIEVEEEVEEEGEKEGEKEGEVDKEKLKELSLLCQKIKKGEPL